MNQTILIREYSAADFDGVLAVIESLPEWFNEDARRRAIPIDLRHQVVFVAEDVGRITGFASLYVFEGRLHIGWLGVARDLQGRGIGTALLRRAEEYGRACGLAEIATYTLGDGVDYPPYEATRAFYLRSGFEVRERARTDNESCPEEIRLRKRIP